MGVICESCSAHTWAGVYKSLDSFHPTALEEVVSFCLCAIFSCPSIVFACLLYSCSAPKPSLFTLPASLCHGWPVSCLCRASPGSAQLARCGSAGQTQEAVPALLVQKGTHQAVGPSVGGGGSELSSQLPRSQHVYVAAAQTRAHQHRWTDGKEPKHLFTQQTSAERHVEPLLVAADIEAPLLCFLLFALILRC